MKIMFYYIGELMNDYLQNFNIVRDDITITEKIKNVFWGLLFGGYMILWISVIFIFITGNI